MVILSSMDEITHPVAALRAPVETPLRRVMRDQGRTQKWLAAQVGTDSAQISDYCRGVHLPQASTRLAIAKTLGRHVDELWPDQAEVAA